MSDSHRSELRRIFLISLSVGLSAVLAACSPPPVDTAKSQSTPTTLSVPPIVEIPIETPTDAASETNGGTTVENVPAASTAAPTASTSLFNGLENLNLGTIVAAFGANEVLLISPLSPDALKTALFDLVQYMRNNTDTRTPSDVLSSIPKYRRLEMFGTWVNEDGPANCYNTRTEVLLRDLSGTKVSFSAANPCNVSRGLWNDPYSGTNFKTANAMQVDHVVPLKNAYRSGAHAWSRERRCHYANFLDDAKHLLAVSGRENMAKGDSGPENYLPPDVTYVCTYIANWLRIKASWNLQFSTEETWAIEMTLKDHACKTEITRLPLTEIRKNRTASNRMNGKCGSP